MNDVSTFRLYVLRAAYLLIAVGLGIMIWPSLLHTTSDLEHMRGVVRALLAAVGLLALLGLRYPLAMLPLLFFELAWKAIWIVAIGLPLWRADALTDATRATWFDCVFGVAVVLVAVPWPYVVRQWVRRPGEPWRRPTSRPVAHETVAG